VSRPLPAAVAAGAGPSARPIGVPFKRRDLSEVGHGSTGRQAAAGAVQDDLWFPDDGPSRPGRARPAIARRYRNHACAALPARQSATTSSGGSFRRSSSATPAAAMSPSVMECTDVVRTGL